MPKELDKRQKLRILIESKKIVRNGINTAYKQLNELESDRESLRKKHKNTEILDYKISTLEDELTKTEDSMYKSNFGEPINYD